MAKKPAYLHPQQLALYEELITGLDGVEKKGASMPYTSFNGHMFSFLDADGHLSLRLPEKERRVMTDRFKAGQSIQHGAVMKEYVRIPDQLLADANKLRPYVKIALDYVRTLKPKK